MKFECNHCSKRFTSENSLSQHNSAVHSGSVKESGKINFKKYMLFSMVVLILVFSSITVYSYSQRAGDYDDFAKCLTEKGAVVYGNDFCSYTNKQLNYFGNSDKYLNYVKCSANQALCDEKGVTLTPTWEINGEMHKSVQTFERLSALSGCEI